MSSLCGSNFEYTYLNFMLCLIMLTDSEDGLKNPFQGNHIEAEFIHNCFTHIVLRGKHISFQV
jgi:hypothetical protein